MLLKHMDGTLTCNLRGGGGTQLLCLSLISCTWDLDAKGWAMEICMIVETNGLTGDNILSTGKLAQSRNSITIHIIY